MEKTYSAKLTLEQESCINGRNVYHYLIDTSIGEIHIVEYEEKSKVLTRFTTDDKMAAIKKYNACCKKILSGK
jgi:hypothetical protein